MKTKNKIREINKWINYLKNTFLLSKYEVLRKARYCQKKRFTRYTETEKKRNIMRFYKFYVHFAVLFLLM